MSQCQQSTESELAQRMLERGFGELPNGPLPASTRSTANEPHVLIEFETAQASAMAWLCPANRNCVCAQLMERLAGMEELS